MSLDVNSSHSVVKRQLSRKISSLSMGTEDVFGDPSLHNDLPSIDELYSEDSSTPWLSIYVASSIAFVQAFQFSIFVASLWNYVKSIDDSISVDTFGYIVGAYSLGQSISSPLFGWWSNHIEKIKIPLFAGLSCMLTGNVLYSLLYVLPGNKVIWAMVARFITGLGSGNSSLLRAYVSTASLGRDRSKALAYVTAGDTMGLTTGPLFQILFLFLGDQLSICGFPLTMYNSPAFFAVLMDALGILLIGKYFVEDYRALEHEKEQLVTIPHADILAVSICILTRFSQAFMMTNFEGTGNIYVETMFNFDSPSAVTNNNLLYAAQAFIGFTIYFLFIRCRLNKILRLRLAIVLSMIGFLCYHLSTYPFNFYEEKVKIYYGNETVNTSSIGCDISLFEWCSNLSTFSAWIYYVSNIVFICTLFPIINISLTTLFSKIIGPRRQGTMQGVFQLAGAMAKMCGPPIMTIAFQSNGPRYTWQIQMIQLSIVLIIWIIFITRMVPLQRHSKSARAAFWKFLKRKL